MRVSQVCKALSTEKQVRFAPFGEGKLTEVLQGFLGGNAIVLCMTCLSRSDSVKVRCRYPVLQILSFELPPVNAWTARVVHLFRKKSALVLFEIGISGPDEIRPRSKGQSVSCDANG